MGYGGDWVGGLKAGTGVSACLGGRVNGSFGRGGGWIGTWMGE